MKTKNLPGRIVRLAMLMALMLIVVISCKKKDDTPTPPTPGPTPPATPDVFSNKPLQMMSDYEIANHLDFPGHIINRFGRGIVGGEDPEIPNPLKAIGKTLWEVHDYIHTEKRFDQIDDGIKEIEGQISQLQQQMAALAAQLSVDVSELEQFMTGGVISGYITNINGVMDSTTHNGFGYFPMEGRKYQAGQITQQQMNIDTGYARTFANNVFNKASGYDVCTWSEQLNAQICPNVGGSQTNALTTYANLLLQKVTPLGLNDSASMMKAYLLLENYFLQIVNYQFQCVTVWSNACNFYDTSGYQANLYYTGTFQKNIKQEIDAYFSAVGYLAINLNDYRSTANALADLQYVQTGLKPDNLFIHILARAQFLANLYYDALGLNYPVMCGTVITPKNYAIEHGSVVDSITFSIAGKNLSSTATNTKNGGVGLASQFPYTAWITGSTAVCSADNHWNVYRFGKMGIADGGWGSSAQTILLVDNGDVNYPWTHKVTVQGKVTPLFYNPQNPDETSPVKTSTCTMQFAYFSARWNWGYLYLTMTGPYSQRPTLLFMGNFSNPAQRPPVMGTTDKQGNFYQHSTSGFNLPYSNSSSMNYSGTTVGTAYYYILGDMLYVNMAGSASNLPNIGGGTMTMYGASSIFFDNYGKSDNYMLSRLGTGMNFFNGAGNSYQSNGNILIGRTESVGTYIYFTGSSTMTTGTDYQPSVEYIYNATNISEVPLNVHANAFMAVAYNGTYNIFQK